MTTIQASPTIKLRAAWWLRFVGVLPLVPSLILYIALRGGTIGTPAWLVWEWIFVAGFICTTNSWFGVNLTPTELVVNNIRRRRVAWANVQAVTQEPFMGGRRVVVWTDRGDRIPLRIPAVDLTGIGAKRFERQYHVVGQWWLSHRGPWWRPGYWPALA